MNTTPINIGIIGYGRMGKMFFKALNRSELWNVARVCDVNEEARALARLEAPTATVTANEDDIFNDPSIQAVVLTALADSRYLQILKAIEHGKHVIAEKPLAFELSDEKRIVKAAQQAKGLFSTVHLYLRNAWYHNAIKEFIKSGEIGDLAILRVCHMTPGLSPGEGHEYEGPSFHDCGMHYVDITRWYAESEFKTWDAQALRMWDYKDPWWLQCHGTFQNGVVFDITQGFVYGQLSKDQAHNSYIDIIGTKGIAHMTHNFTSAIVDLRGVTRTEHIVKPFGGKNIDVLVEQMARSIITGKRDPNMPRLEDAEIASEYAWRFLDSAWSNDMPAIGDLATLEQIHERRAHMTFGYGLLRQDPNAPAQTKPAQDINRT